ncbi:MAG TPA: diaminopimelate epimerase [Actinomycetota bacterium]|jgi:diaminopimelate epimerase|nr:diaminopimelate epimerase [Actinomycetota bacterium]
MRFAKYEGIGNDFVMIADPADELRLSTEQVRRLCDRRFGIGADGVIRVAPGSDGAELFMDYVNSDGSIGEMCGNGIRCLALFARAEGMTGEDVIRVGTRAGVKTVSIIDGDGVRVDMGAPIFAPAEVPVEWDGTDALHAKIELETEVVEAAVLSMGNPHAVLFVDDTQTAPVATLGPVIERHHVFPNGTNVEFATVESNDRVRMRVWERGAGETLACGTGAAAVAVASRLLHGVSSPVTVALPGGDLVVEWGGRDDREASVFMTGPARRVFDGDVSL